MSAVKGKAQKQKSKSKSQKQEKETPIMGACNQKESISESLIQEPKEKSLMGSFKKKVSKAMKSLSLSEKPSFPKMVEVDEETLEEMYERLDKLELELENSGDYSEKQDIMSIMQGLELDIRAAELEKYYDEIQDKERALTKESSVKSSMVILEAKTPIPKKHFYLLGKDPKNNYLWTFPVGKLEESESFKDAAKREFYEEAGFELKGPLTWLGIEEWTDPETKLLHRTGIYHAYEPENSTAAKGELADVKFLSYDMIKQVSEEGKGRKCVDFLFTKRVTDGLQMLYDKAVLKTDKPSPAACVNDDKSTEYTTVQWGDDHDGSVHELTLPSNKTRTVPGRRIRHVVNVPTLVNAAQEGSHKIVLEAITTCKNSLLEEMTLQYSGLIEAMSKISSQVEALEVELTHKFNDIQVSKTESATEETSVVEDCEDKSDVESLEGDKALFLAQCLKLTESKDKVIADMWKVFIEYASNSETDVQAKLLEDVSANKLDLINSYFDPNSEAEPSIRSGDKIEIMDEDVSAKSFSEKKAIFESQTNSPELIIENEKRIKMNRIMQDFILLHGLDFEYDAHFDHLTVGDKKVHVRICPDDGQPFVFTAKNKPSNRCDIFEVLESKKYALCEFQAKTTCDVPMLKALADRFTEYMTSYTDLQNCDTSTSV